MIDQSYEILKPQTSNILWMSNLDTIFDKAYIIFSCIYTAWHGCLIPFPPFSHLGLHNWYQGPGYTLVLQVADGYRH